METIETLKRMYIVQICGASISLLASSTIVFVSRKSFFVVKEKKDHLGNNECTPYRRILIGLSFSDILQSLSLLFGPFISPEATSKSPWAFGNLHSCEAFGFLLYAGQLGVCLYSTMLSFYFLRKIKYKMSNDDFRVKWEKKMHAFIVIHVACSCLAALFTGSFNPTPNSNACYIYPAPAECRDVPELECERGADHFFGFILNYIVTSAFALFAVIILLGLISRHILYQQAITSGDRQSSNGRWCRFGSFCNLFLHIFHRRDNEGDSYYLARMYLSQMLTQSLLYSIVFMITFSSIWIMLILRFLGKPVPLWFIYSMVWFQSFSGALNILVFARPKISVLRLRCPELSWFQAFLLVLRAGVDLPDKETLSRISNGNRHNSPIENNHHASRDHGNDDIVEYLFCCWGLCKLKLEDIEYMNENEFSYSYDGEQDSQQASHEERSHYSSHDSSHSSLRISSRVKSSSSKNHDSALECIQEEGENLSDSEDSRQDEITYFKRVLNMMDGDVDISFSDDD